MFIYLFLLEYRISREYPRFQHGLPGTLDANEHLS